MFIGDGFPEIIWPTIPGSQAARIQAMLFQLEQSQWWPSDIIARCQFGQVRRVIEFAARTVPFYRELYGTDSLSLSSPEEFIRLPILSRPDVQSADTTMHSTALPKRHGQVGQTLTSGSSGQPVRALSTEVTRSFWRVFTLRDHFWHRRDFSGKLAAIRDTDSNDARPPLGKTVSNWGSATAGVVETGPGALLTIQSNILEQADWISRVDPDYLIVYPSTALALASQHVNASRKLHRLREIRTFGEILEPNVRQIIRDSFGVNVVDMYSSQEVGYIALQCPNSESYHVQAENVLLEILDDSGKPCGPGQVGRVVVTTLHNFAMPLIRYDLGDYAEVGPPCPCGRGLPVLTRIVGRQRNMLRLPDGRQVWPTLIRGDRPEQLPPIQQFQLIQRTLSELELKVVLPAQLSQDQESFLKQYLRQTLGHPFEIVITRVTDIPRSPTGKYEEFRSEITAH